jgi:hypothetical protein
MLNTYEENNIRNFNYRIFNFCNLCRSNIKWQGWNKAGNHSNTNLDRYTYANVNAHTNTDEYPDTNADEYTYANKHANADEYSYANKHANANELTDTDLVTDTDAGSYTDTNSVEYENLS